MAYNIGQIRFNPNKFQESKYYKSLNISTSTYTQRLLENSGIKSFTDFAIKLVNNEGEYANIFHSNRSYYLKFSLFTRDDSEQKILLKLKSGGTNQQGQESTDQEREQLIDTFYVPKNTIETIVPFETIISPKDSYSTLVWELQRISQDYERDDDENISQGALNGRKLKFDDNSIQISIITIEGIEGQGLQFPFKKMGIQARPSFLMCINRQAIRVGKSGIYEINNGVEINNIGFVPKDENDYFIMDYEY